MNEPIIIPGFAGRPEDTLIPKASGGSFVIEEWKGSGPPWLHVHHSDDEAWIVLEGSLRFRFLDREVDAPAGTTVFVPAGVPHTYTMTTPPGRYLILLTPRLRELIASLHSGSKVNYAEVFARYDSEILEPVE